MVTKPGTYGGKFDYQNNSLASPLKLLSVLLKEAPTGSQNQGPKVERPNIKCLLLFFFGRKG